MTDDDIFQRIKSIFIEEFELEPEQLVPEATLFDDLGLDSLEGEEEGLALADSDELGLALADGLALTEAEGLTLGLALALRLEDLQEENISSGLALIRRTFQRLREIC